MRCGGAWACQRRKQFADQVIAFDRMPQRKIVDALVAVPSPGFLAAKISRIDEIGEDALCGSFSDADGCGDLSHACTRVPCDVDEHMGVVRQERPSGHAVSIPETTRR